MALNPYEILGLQHNCTDKEIKQAYKMAAKKYHPDKGGNPKQFALVQLAYDTLKDKDKRQRFDDQGFMDGDNTVEKSEQVVQLLQQLFFSILQNSNPEFFDSLDLIGSLKANIETEILKLEESIAGIKQLEIKQKKALKALKNKLKRKENKPNMLLHALEASIAGIPNQITFIKYRIDIQKLMYDMAAEYSYDFEKMPIFSGNSNWTISQGTPFVKF